MSEKQMTKQEMLNHLEKGMDLVKKRYGSADEEYYSALKELGIEFSEERLIEDYSRVKDTEALFDAYYKQYGDILDSEHEKEWINSDIFFELIDRIIPQHFDFEETGDPFFITTALNELCMDDLRKADQKEIEKILRALITYSKTRDQHILEETLEMPDMNGLIRELVRVCHNRDASFRKLIQEMYECFDDMDQKIFPSVYKEAMNAKKK